MPDPDNRSRRAPGSSGLAGLWPVAGLGAMSGGEAAARAREPVLAGGWLPWLQEGPVPQPQPPAGMAWGAVALGLPAPGPLPPAGSQCSVAREVAGMAGGPGGKGVGGGGQYSPIPAPAIPHLKAPRSCVPFPEGGGGPVVATSWLLGSFTLLTLDSRGHVSLYTTGRTGRTEGQGHRGAVCPNPQEQPTLLPYYVQIITYSKYPGRLSVLQSAGFLRK